MLPHHGGPGTRPSPLGLGANPSGRACHTCFAMIRALRSRAKCWPHSLKSSQPKAFLHVKHVWDYFLIFSTIRYHGLFKKKLRGILKTRYLPKAEEIFLFRMCSLIPYYLSSFKVHYIISRNVEMFPKKIQIQNFVQGNIEASRWFYLLKLKFQN